jgi:hypothetical protein
VWSYIDLTIGTESKLACFILKLSMLAADDVKASKAKDECRGVTKIDKQVAPTTIA